MDIDIERWAQLGFSFFIAVYLLVKTQEKLNEIALTLAKVNENLEKHIAEKDLALRILERQASK